ncbi:HEAT repeat domain-containing protein, partial [Candidatus Neomarinimicrobiota bacterium]
QYLHQKNRKIDYIKNLANESKISKYPKLINQLLAPLRIKRIINALAFDFGNKKDIVYIDAEFAFTNIGRVNLKPILTASTNQNPMIRRIAVKSLTHIDDKRSLDILIQLLEDEDNTVRASAANGLYYNGDERAVMPLTLRLKDEDALVRENAAKALGYIRDENAIDPLVNLLNGKYPVIADFKLNGGNYYASAAFALGKIGNKKAIDALKHATKSSSPDTYQAANKALEKITEQSNKVNP